MGEQHNDEPGVWNTGVGGGGTPRMRDVRKEQQPHGDRGTEGSRWRKGLVCCRGNVEASEAQTERARGQVGDEVAAGSAWLGSHRPRVLTANGTSLEGLGQRTDVM